MTDPTPSPAPTPAVDEKQIQTDVAAAVTTAQDVVSIFDVIKKSPSKALSVVTDDVLKLQNPALAAGVVAEVVALVSPFGLNVGSAGPILGGVLVAIGSVGSAIQKSLAELKMAAKK